MYDIQTYSLSPFLNPHINVLRTTGYHFIDYVQYSTTVQKFKFKYEYDDEDQDQDQDQEKTVNEQVWNNLVVANKPRLAIFIHLACGRSAASSF